MRCAGYQRSRNVCLWHLADMLSGSLNVRFWGQSGHDANGAHMSANDPERALAASRLDEARKPKIDHFLRG